MIEAPAAHRTDRNTLFFTPCVAQGSKRDPVLLPALRRAPKETLFCSLRCAGPRKTPFFAPCVARGAENHGFSLSSAANSPLNRPPICRCAFASGRTVYICAPII